MPDALICYPGSIEKLKLLGATYLLTLLYLSIQNLMGVATSILICSYVSDFTSIALLLLLVCSGGTAPPKVYVCMYVDFGAPFFMTVSKGHCRNDSICSLVSASC